ncbi:GPI-anchored surface protein, putative [Bodo saltans]|uniref:GPI-anchored surface protein, putative n=1 Tax=Bodo saltans TaxID=75058 RepID=A0A0S4IY46_BODSA|nr:GPI-anchored surface protein, putative [Bodo saltans]|eukprot:CUG06002.1 GPI-anchored surface protein, putative [Bodo saltans]
MTTQFNWSRGDQSFKERMQNVDPDFRQMALYDLGSALAQAEFTINDSEQQLALTWVLKCFSDTEKNTEVVNNAVRIVGPLALKFSQRNQENLILTLSKVVCDAPPGKLTLPEATALRENAAMSLKLAAQAFAKQQSVQPDVLRATVSIIVTSIKTLARGLSAGGLEQRIIAEIFDVLSDYADVYGVDISAAHNDVFQICMQYLTADTVVRKRATKFLSRIAPHLCNELFSSVTGILTSGLKVPKTTKTFVEVCNAICRTSARRFDDVSVDLIVTSFLTELQRLLDLPEDVRDSREVDETREQILCALESFVIHCKSHIEGKLDRILKAVSAHVQWDPNFCVIDDEEMEMYDDDEGMMDFDDGDTSWKVRIASAKCLSAIVQAFAVSRPDVAAAIVEVLLNRLGERVEQVRLSVIDVLLKLIELASKGSPKSSDSLFTPATGISLAAPHSPLANLLLLHRDSIVEKVVASSRHKDLKVKLGSVIALRELFSSFGGGALVKPMIEAAVSAMEADARRQLPALRPECLALIQYLVVASFRLPAHEELRHELANKIEQRVLPFVLESLQDRFFKTSLTALRVAQQLIFLAFERPAVAGQIFSAVHQRLVAADSDVEMKRSALETIALMIAHLHQPLSAGYQDLVQQVLQYFAQLLGSETVRIAVCKSIDVLAQAPNLPLSQLSVITVELVALLRKSDRQVRENALVALNRLALNYSSTTMALPEVQNEIVNALSTSCAIEEKDLFITSQALALGASIAVAHPSVARRLIEAVIPAAVGFLSSNHIQGLALEKCIRFVSTCAVVVPESADGILTRIRNAATQSTSIMTLSVLSSAVGATIGAIAQSGNVSTVNAKLEALVNHQNKGFAFACIGSCGQHIALADNLKALLVRGNSGDANSNEDISAAAALGLGRAAASLHNASLLNDIATILTNSATSSLHRQHTLRALKESITASTQDKTKTSPLYYAPTAKAILAVLLGQVSSGAEDFFLDVVMESAGRLTSLCIEGCAPDLALAASSGANPSAATIAIGAAKFITPHGKAEEDIVASILPSLLTHLTRSATPIVRRGSIQLFHATLLNRGHLLLNLPSALIQQFLKNLFEELVVDKTLVNEVDLGPFKHRVDNGLELRKVAHECTQSLLDELQARGSAIISETLNQAGLWQFLASQFAISTGLPEEQELEVCNSSRNGLVKIAALQPSALDGAGAVIGKKTTLALNTKVKDGVDVEKTNDYMRIAVVCMIVLQRDCPNLIKDAVFAEAWKSACASDKYAAAAAIVESAR